MQTKIQLRELTADERTALEKLVRSRTAETRLVERAKIILAAAVGEGSSHIADRLEGTRVTVYTWIKRFNADGLAGLEDRPRRGRPSTYPPAQVAEVIAAALTKPAELGLGFASWTLDRLVAYLAEAKGIAMKRTRLDEVLRAEGLRWRKHETWFGQRVDPEFAAKRGSSNSSTRHHPRTASSSASTRWGRRAPRASAAGSSSTPRRPSTTRPGGRAKRSTTAGAAEGTASARSARRPGTR